MKGQTPDKALAGPWAIMCAGKSSNEIRTCDRHGCGQYSTSRSQRPHQGIDVLCPDGSTVYAPFTGMIVGQEKPYKNKNAINNGVRISGRGGPGLAGDGVTPGGNRLIPLRMHGHASCVCGQQADLAAGAPSAPRRHHLRLHPGPLEENATFKDVTGRVYPRARLQRPETARPVGAQTAALELAAPAEAKSFWRKRHGKSLRG
ncbi:Leukocyte cell-derived chemotaxin-2 [Tupaia chinensis]|uniref:Leukocyte cell-derived chemotaxin-2 n=1 Tax=Tupaia chinensis TaxID=246437 RepID=L8Y560_TUPCH|nr:Leukocyte cell-derived chemotaxin-2 [Tupaia chinensis]